MAQVNPTPRGKTLTPNLVIHDCAKAIDFYKRALGAEEVMRMMAPDGRSVWHAELRIGDALIFCNDEMRGMGPAAPTADRPVPVQMWLGVPDCDAAYRRATEAGAQGAMPPADMFWGDRCASITDPFGYVWSFAQHVRDMTAEEMRRAGEEFARKMAAKGGPGTQPAA
jgi:uncharacterized glyoxalase superfamily protein PhnB